MRNLGPKYEKEFFLIHNPKAYVHNTKGEFWHCYIGDDGAYYEVSQFWDNRFAPTIYKQEDAKYNPENYRRDYVNDEKAYYVFVDSRCKLRRWMKENFNG